MVPVISRSQATPRLSTLSDVIRELARRWFERLPLGCTHLAEADWVSLGGLLDPCDSWPVPSTAPNVNKTITATVAASASERTANVRVRLMGDPPGRALRYGRPSGGSWRPA